MISYDQVFFSLFLSKSALLKKIYEKITIFQYQRFHKIFLMIVYLNIFFLLLLFFSNNTKKNAQMKPAHIHNTKKQIDQIINTTFKVRHLCSYIF